MEKAGALLASQLAPVHRLRPSIGSAQHRHGQHRLLGDGSGGRRGRRSGQRRASAEQDQLGGHPAGAVHVTRPRPPRHGQGLMGAAANNAGAKAHRKMPRALHVAAGDCDRLEDAGEHRARSHQPRWVTTLFFSRRAAAALTSFGARPQCGRSCKSRTRTFSGRTGRGCASRGRSGSSTRSCRR